MDDMEYDTENIEVYPLENGWCGACYLSYACCELIVADSQCYMFSQKPTGFDATLICYMSKRHGGCGKAQQAPVLLTHSHTTLLTCLEELRRGEKWEICFF